jgi:hypothetical protein
MLRRESCVGVAANNDEIQGVCAVRMKKELIAGALVLSLGFASSALAGPYTFTDLGTLGVVKVLPTLSTTRGRSSECHIFRAI